MPGFTIVQLWELSVFSVAIQAVLSWMLLRGQFRRRLPTAAAPA